MHPTNTADVRFSYRTELDGIRGISILLVFVHHVYSPVLPGGFLGVDIFFVLSGYLITSLLLQEWHRDGSISLKNFYIRRALRLVPALITIAVGLGAFALVFLDASRATKTYQGIGLSLSYISNWLYAFNITSGDNPLGVTWSLAIEEQFYLVWPFVLRIALGSKNISRRVFVITCILLIALVALYRGFLLNSSATIVRLYYASDTRADGLLIGCLIAFLVSWQLLPVSKTFCVVIKLLSAFAAVFLTILLLAGTWESLLLSNATFFTLVPLAAGVIVVMVLVCPPKAVIKVLQLTPLVWVGRISYGLYLWHWPVRWYIYPKYNLPASDAQLLTAFFLPFALAALSFYLVEQRFLRLKNRFTTHTSNRSTRVLA